MRRFSIILSQGSIPWLNLSQAITYATELEFDGIELLPFRWIIEEMQTYTRNQKSKILKYITCIVMEERPTI